MYSVAWDGEALWDSSVNVPPGMENSSDGSFVIDSNLVPYTEYRIEVRDEFGETSQVTCTVVTPETGEDRTEG